MREAGWMAGLSSDRLAMRVEVVHDSGDELVNVDFIE
jgi:hypothetical protein